MSGKQTFVRNCQFSSGYCFKVISNKKALKFFTWYRLRLFYLLCLFQVTVRCRWGEQHRYVFVTMDLKETLVIDVENTLILTTSVRSARSTISARTQIVLCSVFMDNPRQKVRFHIFMHHITPFMLNSTMHVTPTVLIDIRYHHACYSYCVE